MVVLERFKFLLRVFQVFGFAPINVARKNIKTNNFVDTLVNLIPTALTTVASLSIACYLLIYPHFEALGAIHVIIHLASLFALSLVVITGNGQSFFNKSIHRDINRQIRQIEKKMLTDINTKSMNIRFTLKTLLIFSLFFLSQGLVFYESYITSYSYMWSALLTSLSRLIWPIAVLHAVLYSDILSFLFQQLTHKIRNSATFFHTSSKVDLLKNVKVMHMDLWNILVQINRYFGWNLLFIVINSFVYMTHQLYFIFVTLQEHHDKLGVIVDSPDSDYIIAKISAPDTTLVPPINISVSYSASFSHTNELLSEGLASLTYGMTSLYILINSCQACSLEVKCFTENVEQYVFWTSDNDQLHTLKVEIFHQVNNFSMSITAAGFFQMDRERLGNVFASCCMYMVIFIQFFLASEKKP